jgi:chromosome segregation ATPase
MGFDNAVVSNEMESGVGPIFPQLVPSVLSADDVVTEIGKHAVRAANAEKAYMMLAGKISGLQSQISESNTMSARIKVLEESNRLYQDKNKDMDKALVDERIAVRDLAKELEEARRERDLLKKEVDRLSKDTAAKGQKRGG